VLPESALLQNPKKTINKRKKLSNQLVEQHWALAPVACVIVLQLLKATIKNYQIGIGIFGAHH